MTRTATPFSAAVATAVPAEPRPPLASAPGPATPETEHLRQLDGLRFFSFLTVFGFHLTPGFPCGGMGVSVFFCLSGFLITQILLRLQAVSGPLSHFYARRALRIFPLYYLALTGLLLLGELKHPVADFLYLQNFLLFRKGAGWDATHSHFWTLCVEEQYYLVFPLVLRALRGSPPRRSLSLFLLAVFSLFFCQLAIESRYPFGLKLGLPTHAGQYLLFGSLAGYCQITFPELRTKGRVALALALGLWVIPHLIPRDVPIPYAARVPFANLWAGCVLSLIVFGVANLRAGWLRAFLSLPPLVYLGKISYGLYVYHLPTLHYVSALAVLGSGSLWLRGTISLAVTIAVASVSWFGFEQPILRAKRYFPY
jgi:peptidoglycan/LPS O-acetylase OafA/YrhL